MVYLTFDIEEFDVPREKGLNYSLEEAMNVSYKGTKKILDILKINNIPATLFCTLNFINNAPDLINRAINEGHEIASHGVDHWNPKESDPMVSKKEIENKLNIKIYGYRQPRMFPVSDNLIRKCGYKYNSSLNPAFIPGKYMHLNIPRTAFIKNDVLQIPASVSPRFRIPLFWLSLHNFPINFYIKLVKNVLKKDGYFMTYFHPWEFVNHTSEIRKYLLPIVKRNIGQNMCNRLNILIKHLKNNNQEFSVLNGFQT